MDDDKNEIFKLDDLLKINVYNKSISIMSFKQKKRRLVKDKKTVLPPCNICGSTATG